MHHLSLAIFINRKKTLTRHYVPTTPSLSSQGLLHSKGKPIITIPPLRPATDLIIPHGYLPAQTLLSFQLPPFPPYKSYPIGKPDPLTPLYLKSK